jgi:hypothetical protein
MEYDVVVNNDVSKSIYKRRRTYMGNSIKEKIGKLLVEVSNIEVIKAIGQTGDINYIPKAGEADIDIFVLGDIIPSYEDRKALYDGNDSLFEQCILNVCEGGDWGTGDILIIDGVETMLMYFRTDETLQYVNDILEGKHLECINGFYPVGRCATLRNINVIYDESKILGSLKEKLSVYPDELRNKMVTFHLEKTIDEEGLGRAILRKDVLYYHMVIEHSIDHYLQALYAVNKTYFPSRKRTKQYIDSFEKKPENCYERLMEVIKLGSNPDGIEQSCSLWRGLATDLTRICNN